MERRRVDLPKRIGYFKGPWGFLSNFYPVSVKLWIEAVPYAHERPGATVEEYASVEHAYQAAKFLDAAIREKFRFPGLAPGQAKTFAYSLKQKGKVRVDWELESLTVMRELLIQKFRYSILRRKLLSTFGAELVEGNFWHDNFYGNCVCDECADIPGLNHLGRLLMELRKL
jgi:ribA/ribD-fused uncharacterized protein